MSNVLTMTTKRIERLVSASQGQLGHHRDPEVRGLYLQVVRLEAKDRNAAASWILRFQRDGKEHQMGLGSLSDVPLDEARKRTNKKYRGPRFKKVQRWHPIEGRMVTTGWRYIVNQPTEEALRLMDKMMTWPRISFHRFDIALDFVTRTKYQANAIRLHLLRHLILRWNTSPYMVDVFGETTYLAKHRDRRKLRERNAAIYADLLCKLTQEPCCHFEPRFIGAAGVARQGMEVPTDLLGLDIAKMVARNFVLVADYSDALAKLLAENPGNRIKHATQDYRAQSLRRNYKLRLKHLDLAVLRVPSKLTFAGRPSDSPKHEHACNPHERNAHAQNHIPNRQPCMLRSNSDEERQWHS